VAAVPYPPPPEIVLPHPWVLGEYRLRPPEPRDVPALTEALQSVEVQRFTRVPSPYDVHDAEQYVRSARDGLERGDAIRLLVTDPPGEQLYGACGLEIDWRDGVAELGYWLHANARGRGIATRVGSELCRFGFGLGLGRIHLQAAVNNPGSVEVARRIGFVQEGTLRLAAIDGPAGNVAAPRADMHVLGLLPGELLPVAP
jgi:RimJ/RimL family protein N-acetyltransferase